MKVLLLPSEGLATTAALAIATGLQDGGVIPRGAEILGVAAVVLALAGVGILTMARRFLPRPAPAAGPGGEFFAQLLSGLTSQTRWQAEVTATLDVLAEKSAAHTVRLEEIRAAILADLSKTRHDYFVPNKETINSIHNELLRSGGVVDQVDQIHRKVVPT